MVLAYFTHDIEMLKACSLTCYSWYIVAAPHLHHTFVFGETSLGRVRGGLKPLSRLHELGLSPLVKELQIRQLQFRWFLPRSFSRRDLRRFSAFTNVQRLTIQQLDLHKFFPGVERYFRHFSPTLRSITLETPRCTPRQLFHFFSLFPNLDDIEIRFFSHVIGIPDDPLVPFSTPTLRGQLTLSSFTTVDPWKDLAASCGLRFRCINLHPVSQSAPVLLAACAETLETLRIEPDNQAGKNFRLDLPTNLA